MKPVIIKEPVVIRSIPADKKRRRRGSIVQLVGLVVWFGYVLACCLTGELIFF